MIRKTYDTSTPLGRQLYEKVMRILDGYHNIEWQKAESDDIGNVAECNLDTRYGSSRIVKSRIGQGTFRLLVTKAYHYGCAITGVKTLPALEAAHIRPYSDYGPNKTCNGLLLRRDIHALFDKGYITINGDIGI
jgi:putative restriction endonuclease